MQRAGTPVEKIVAVLHDVVEDTDWTFDALRQEGFPPVIIEALDRVTKRNGEEYENFVRRSAEHPISRNVKLADLEDNMDLRREAEVKDEYLPRLKKYVKAWHFLQAKVY